MDWLRGFTVTIRFFPWIYAFSLNLEHIRGGTKGNSIVVVLFILRSKDWPVDCVHKYIIGLGFPSLKKSAMCGRITPGLFRLLALISFFLDRSSAADMDLLPLLWSHPISFFKGIIPSLQRVQDRGKETIRFVIKSRGRGHGDQAQSRQCRCSSPHWSPSLRRRWSSRCRLIGIEVVGQIDRKIRSG